MDSDLSSQFSCCKSATSHFFLNVETFIKKKSLIFPHCWLEEFFFSNPAMDIYHCDESDVMLWNLCSFQCTGKKEKKCLLFCSISIIYVHWIPFSYLHCHLFFLKWRELLDQCKHAAGLKGTFSTEPICNNREQYGATAPCKRLL